MSEHKIALHRSRLGFQVIGVSLLAMIVAVLLFLSINSLGGSIRDTALFDELAREDDYLAGMLQQFQDYVTVNQLHSTDYLQVRVWLSNNTGIGFLYDHTSEESTEEGAYDYPITFVDGTVNMVPYVSSTRYSGLIQIIAFLVSFVAFIVIMGVFVRRILSDIKQLSHDMIILTGGDLNHRVHLKGNGELAELAQHMDEMRCSMIERIDREDEAITANRELITALSHDLRTPLTKQMGYLEVAMSGTYKENDQAMQACLTRVYKATQEIKERSEELFAYFLVFAEQSGPEMERVDGQLLLSQLLDEQGDFLRTKGFRYEAPAITKAFALLVNIQSLQRIIDNISSNIIKYADIDSPIAVEHVIGDGSLTIRISNSIKAGTAHMEGTRIGIRSAMRLAEMMDGALRTDTAGHVFTAALTLPLQMDAEA